MHKQTFLATLTISALTAGGIATAHAQQGKPAGAPADKAGVYSATPIYSESMTALDRAAQRLRESIQSLATKKEGPQREQAMDAAYRALIDTQNAMVALPAEYRVEGIAVSNRPILKANPAQNRTYGDSMKELQLAADRLRESIQAMAQRPVGPSRNEAIKEAHAALFQTQQAMTLVPGMRTVATGASAPSGKTGVYSATAIHSESMSALVQAAQRLRESVQSLSQKPAGTERDQAMELAKKALIDTQKAMVALPAEYRVEGVVVSNRPIVKADPAQNRTFGDAMKELHRASDRLHQAIQAMAQRPAGPERNDAIKQAHMALFQTEQAMGLVPGPMASYPGAPDVTSGGKAAGGGSAGMQQGSGASAGGGSAGMQQGSGASAGGPGMQPGGAGGK